MISFSILWLASNRIRITLGQVELWTHLNMAAWLIQSPTICSNSPEIFGYFVWLIEFKMTQLWFVCVCVCVSLLTLNISKSCKFNFVSPRFHKLSGRGASEDWNSELRLWLISWSLEMVKTWNLKWILESCSPADDTNYKMTFVLLFLTCLLLKI
jgi:hypothetical protein